MKRTMVLVVTALTAAVTMLPGEAEVFAADSDASQNTPTTTQTADMPSAPPDQDANAAKVLVIGSSVSAGWRDDSAAGGFIQRAFDAVSHGQGIGYEIDNQSQPGNGVMHIINQYPTWLDTNHPNVVVLGWGGLDDLHDKTSMQDFRSQIWWQIANALARHAVVFVVTPPVSRASYTNYAEKLPMLFQTEKHVARSFHNPNVYVFDVFNQMKDYLKVHNQTYVPYVADGWHPNAVGHELAGDLLAKDMMTAFRGRPIRFQPR